jgi:hypothetical protein
MLSGMMTAAARLASFSSTPQPLGRHAPHRWRRYLIANDPLLEVFTSKVVPPTRKSRRPMDVELIPDTTFGLWEDLSQPFKLTIRLRTGVVQTSGGVREYGQ